jgi:hypothetical protein
MDSRPVGIYVRSEVPMKGPELDGFVTRGGLRSGASAAEERYTASARPA